MGVLANPCLTGASEKLNRAHLFAKLIESFYASLRLMGISLGFVVQEESDRNLVHTSSTELLRQNLASKPIPVIREADIISARRERGSRIRRREG